MTILGTRPEAIKLAPVILTIRKDARFKCRVCVTAQHRQMLDQVLEVLAGERARSEALRRRLSDAIRYPNDKASWQSASIAPTSITITCPGELHFFIRFSDMRQTRGYGCFV